MTLFVYRVKFDSLPESRKTHMLHRMATSLVPYPIRMPDQLRERLKERARQHDRSLHAEIIGILQLAVDDPASLPLAIDVQALAEALAPRLAIELKKE